MPLEACAKPREVAWVLGAGPGVLRVSNPPGMFMGITVLGWVEAMKQDR